LYCKSTRLPSRSAASVKEVSHSRPLFFRKLYAFAETRRLQISFFSCSTLMGFGAANPHDGNINPCRRLFAGIFFHRLFPPPQATIILCVSVTRKFMVAESIDTMCSLG